jgi:hypothetical protein
MIDDERSYGDGIWQNVSIWTRCPRKRKPMKTAPLFRKLAPTLLALTLAITGAVACGDDVGDDGDNEAQPEATQSEESEALSGGSGDFGTIGGTRGIYDSVDAPVCQQDCASYCTGGYCRRGMTGTSYCSCPRP